jgi:phage terminase large subunit-like protein
MFEGIEERDDCDEGGCHGSAYNDNPPQKPHAHGMTASRAKGITPLWHHYLKSRANHSIRHIRFPTYFTLSRRNRKTALASALILSSSIGLKNRRPILIPQNH